MLKRIRIAVVGFLMLVGTFAHSFEINEAKTILVDFKGKTYMVTQVCSSSSQKECYFYAKDNNPFWFKVKGKNPYLKEI